ncbi:hypothetical protein RIF29_15121 [Crotalaria pallida]|uniref:Uncharacterized protein n=1 Tax=Crotalaria pallida TaxID=3830 RepID=A0AAN9FIF1_CROPI
MHGPWCEIRGTWCPVLDPLGLVHGALSLVRDHWCMVRCEICGSWCMVRDPRCIDPGAWSGATSLAPGAWSGGLAGCLPMHHGGSGWCAMGASPNAFSSHPMDVWSVFPWRGGDSRESSLEPNPGRTWPGACWL